jgi:sugar phosphate isomerase/epimerase
MQSVSRRQFCQRVLNVGGVAAATAAVGPLVLCGDRALAIDPFVRKEVGAMKLSLAAYSFRQSLSKPAGTTGAMDLFDLVDFCRKHQVPGVELTSYYFPEGFDESYLKRLRRHCHAQGVSISGGAIRNDFCVAPEMRQAQLDEVRKWIEAYAILGAPAIRIFAGSPPQGVSRAEAIGRCIEACERACEIGAKHGIFLALENHHGITDTAESMLQVVRGVRSEWFGVNFDSGNFKSTDDPYAELAMIAPYAVNAQVKVEIFEHEKKVEADLPRIIEVLRQAQYGGWVAFEYEADVPAEEAVPGHLKSLANLLS